MAKVRPFDPIIFGSAAVLTLGGFLIFMSASLGLLTRDGAQFSDIAMSQFLLGVVGGGIALFIMSYIPYRFFRRFAPYIFGAAIIVTLMVFIPGLGLELKGARRWIDLGFTTFQPSEALKVAYVIFLGAWLSRERGKGVKSIRILIPFLAITAAAGAVLLVQPDTDTFLVLAIAGTAMLLASGVRLRDIGLLALIGAIAFGSLIAVRPYLLERVTTFLDPSRDPLGAGYQVQQSLIAVGSGQAFGRGFGQSTQKFNYLPEPVSDSIFAVYAEEFGFLGAAALVAGFLLLGLRGLWVAARAPDRFGGLVAVGIVILILSEAYLNIGSMLAVFPLTGMPLPFVSHGGTALFATLASVGILLNISRARAS